MLKVKGAAEQISKDKGDVCAQILDKQRKIAYLDSDSCMVRQVYSLVRFCIYRATEREG